MKTKTFIKTMIGVFLFVSMTLTSCVTHQAPNPGYNGHHNNGHYNNGHYNNGHH